MPTILTAILLFAAGVAGAAEALPGSEACAACHEDGPMRARREAGVPGTFGAAALRASPHAALECTGCAARREEEP